MWVCYDYSAVPVSFRPFALKQLCKPLKETFQSGVVRNMVIFHTGEKKMLSGCSMNKISSLKPYPRGAKNQDTSTFSDFDCFFFLSMSLLSPLKSRVPTLKCLRKLN